MQITYGTIVVAIVVAALVLPPALFFWLSWYGEFNRRIARQRRLSDRAMPHFRKIVEDQGFTPTGSKDRHGLSNKAEYRREEENGDALYVRFNGDPAKAGRITTSVHRVPRNGSGGKEFSESTTWKPFGIFGFNAGYLQASIKRATRRKYSKMARGAAKR